ncbi:MAG: VCBS repeat-containing protein [Alphaproteobacteria bacterium]|nr:VCBS repeat-containing protein [Alphaproteobacteria bacterium]
MPDVLTAKLAGGVARVLAAPTGDAPGVLVESGDGRIFRVHVTDGGELRLEKASAPAAERRDGMLPDGEIAFGTRNIRAAWLTDPTGRYAHGVLGDAIEAEGLAVETADGRRLQFRLPADSVFEDRYPRLADVDGDGEDEIIVVRSYLERGAALAVLKAGPDGLAIVAETPAIGLPNRWLDPIGAADFDGDGRIEIALIQTPHIGGILKLYRWEKTGLRLVVEYAGVSNHAIGSRALGLSAILDADGDGRPDILVPDQQHRTLMALGLRDGKIAEIAEVPHQSSIVTDFVRIDGGGGRVGVVYALADGTVVAVVFPR